MYAVIESYETRPVESALPEAHREYIDIQVLLSGHEQIAWWPTPGLAVAQAYDPERDIAFFDRPDTAGGMIRLVPGRFAVFFPGDAHMPGLRTGPDGEPVKKVVVKIRR
jgi:YhcH/YjgK/YiaL family protein